MPGRCRRLQKVADGAGVPEVLSWDLCPDAGPTTGLPAECLWLGTFPSQTQPPHLPHGDDPSRSGPRTGHEFPGTELALGKCCFTPRPPSPRTPSQSEEQEWGGDSPRLRLRCRQPVS